MKKGLLISTIMMILLASGCATTSNKEMSAQDEARYAAAIERAEAEHPSAIPEGAEYTVVIGESAATDAQAMTAAEMPSIERTFSVSRTEYDYYFAQSPAIVLGRMTLDPIIDGGNLIGYRIRDLKPFAGVDLQDNDIVYGIDGVLPKDPDAYFESWEKAKKGSSCAVNIQRGTERFDLVWTIAE